MRLMKETCRIVCQHESKYQSQFSSNKQTCNPRSFPSHEEIPNHFERSLHICWKFYVLRQLPGAQCPSSNCPASPYARSSERASRGDRSKQPRLAVRLSSSSPLRNRSVRAIKGARSMPAGKTSFAEAETRSWGLPPATCWVL
jgi:hypothetical protein